MRITEQDIARRTVVEAYSRYDCAKANRPVPAFEAWDWSQADTIDLELRGVGLKAGILAGYLLWDRIEVMISDLSDCAVYDKIFPGQSRRLGHVSAAALADWRPNRHVSWYEPIASGRTIDDASPMLFRPAVGGESPASWYVEDGSGRAVAFVANQDIFGPLQTLAVGYLGRRPDPNSSFMRREFSELLSGSASLHA
jgi:hypothetical protein